MRAETLFEQLFFSTVFVEFKLPDGQEGSGTGFIYSVEIGPESVAQFLVTNRHVVDGAERIALRFMAGHDETMTKPLLGTTHRVDLETELDQLFTGHLDPDIDVAVTPISPWIKALKAKGSFVFFRAVSPAIMMTEEKAATLDALEQVTFLGYPDGLFDQVSCLPIARRGATATPASVDYGGKPMFLVDGSVFPGSSGSPVFVADAGGFSVRNGDFEVGSRVMLLGVLAAVYQRAVPVLEVPTAGKSFVTDALDIGVVYKAKTIDECVDLVLAKHGLARHGEQPKELLESPKPDDDVLGADKSG